jgi:peptide/nickel transport system ATP-binding protein
VLPEAARTPLLEVRDLTVAFRTEEGFVRAVDDVSLSVAPGEVVGIVGESGSGKTVSMLAVMRLIRDANAVIEGHVFHRGRDLLQLSSNEIRSVRGAEIAMIFQDPMTSLTPVYTVGWQIAEQLRAHEPMSKKAARARTVELLAEVGVSSPSRRIDDFPHQFSGGMRQRVMIAMALSCNPSLLIADDMGAVADLAERVIVMYAGRIVEEGPRAAVFRDPQHPYTWGLLGSIPRVERPRVGRLAAIPGAPPSPLDLRAGCPFEPRCQHRFDRCATRPELLERVAAGRKDACHLDPAVRPTLRQASLRGEKNVRGAG